MKGILYIVKKENKRSQSKHRNGSFGCVVEVAPVMKPPWSHCNILEAIQVLEKDKDRFQWRYCLRKLFQLR